VGLETRREFFCRSVDSVFERLYAAVTDAPQELIHVTCTGHLSPSGAQKIVNRKGWNHKTLVTHAYHMGCSAAFPAIRMGVGSLALEPSGRVDIVHTEVCSIHLNPTLHHPEQLVVQSLFADGFIRYGLRRAARSDAPGLEVLALHEEIVPDSADAMTWMYSDWGLSMRLSPDVPQKIAGHLAGFLDRLTAPVGIDLQRRRPEIVFAIHPGGPRIIRQLQGLLRLEDWQVRGSLDVLASYGNMSSATLPHIWLNLVNDTQVQSGTLIVSLAFGPGLTICGGIFRKVAPGDP
jgi:predicted naringenin-chalcone synthase